ncbi:MAG: 1-acyl-sn-glycerol-3-phosphate acyltransferase [Solirubrobacteraceae bacterium]
MPPTALRRPVTVAVSLLVCTAGLALSPLLLAFGVLTQALTGRRQPLIVARLTLAYFSHELAALLMCGALWVAAGAGRLIGTRRVQLLHWRLLGWFIGGLAAAGRKALEIDVDTELSSDAGRALEADRPVIVLSRHAGPGDTIFIVDQLMSRFRRRPSVVFKQSIAIDPCVDILSHRLPQAIIDPADREGAKARIEQVLAQLGARGALLLFPEGGNFTDERRRSALDRLRRKGRRRSAARAEGMPHVLPPQPAGALAALDARNGSDVVFVAHTGLGLAAYPGQFWRDMPVGRTLRVRMWLEPSAQVPTTGDEQVAWLYDWWKRIDEWIDAQPSG